MTVECVAAYLGIIRAGCCAVSIADSFSSEEIARRLQISDARGIVTVDTFRRAGKKLAMYEKVMRADAPRAIVIGAEQARRELPRDGDLHWDDFLADAGARFASATGGPEREITILFSSGTTGTPKAIAWNHLTPAKGALEGHVHQDIRTGDVVAWPTNIGWMMGPWLIFAALINDAAMALYEGAPNTEGFTRFVADARVTMLGVVPALVRAWRQSGVMRGRRWPLVQVFSSTGEPSNVEDYLWLMSRTDYRAPVIEYIGGTELGGGYMAGTVTEPASPGVFTARALGLEVMLIGEDGAEPGVGKSGEIFLVPPAIGLSESLLNADHFVVYHAGCPVGPSGVLLRRHGDRIVRLGQGVYRADGRVDDAMNLWGIKIGSLELERVLDGLASVRECAAVGVSPPEGGGAKLVVFVIMEDDATPDDVDPSRLATEMTRELAIKVNPLFRVDDVVLTDHFPRTASNKLMRRSLHDRYVRERG